MEISLPYSYVLLNSPNNIIIIGFLNIKSWTMFYTSKPFQIICRRIAQTSSKSDKSFLRKAYSYIIHANGSNREPLFEDG